LARRGLIITYYFPPAGGGGVQRWVKLIKYLSRLDWHFTIIAAAVEKSNPRDPSFLAELPNDVKIVRGDEMGNRAGWLNHLRSRLSGSYWLRWVSAWYYITDSRKAWNKIAGKGIQQQMQQSQYDLLVFSLPPYSLALLAASCVSNLSVPVCLDLRDPWTINPYKIYPTPVHSLLDREREQRSIAEIPLIISAYRSTIDHFQEHIPHFNQANCLFLPNGYDEEDFSGLPEYSLPFAGDCHIAFSGSFYSHLNNPDILFAAMSHLKKQGIKIHFHHIGDSVYDVLKLAGRHDVEDQFHSWGYQNHRECLKILQAMDAYVLILDERIKNADKTVGGKVYEYLRLQKPILAIVPAEGEAARLIHDTDSGMICSSLRGESVAEALKVIYLKQKRFTFKNIKQYDRCKQAGQLQQFFEKKLT
jgi:glycosyltransferase involved in cell wall biosynthesis